jgi:hypothetical protein
MKKLAWFGKKKDKGGDKRHGSKEFSDGELPSANVEASTRGLFCLL